MAGKERICYDSVSKNKKKEGWEHAGFRKSVSGSIYDRIGRNSFLVYPSQSAGHSGTEIIWKSEIWKILI